MENTYNVFKTICRTCLCRRNRENMVSLVDNLSSDGLSDIGKSVQALCGINIDNDGFFPSLMCSECLTLLRQAIHFKKTCTNSQKSLEHLVTKTSTSSGDFRKELVDFVSNKPVSFHKSHDMTIKKEISTQSFTYNVDFRQMLAHLSEKLVPSQEKHNKKIKKETASQELSKKYKIETVVKIEDGYWKNEVKNPDANKSFPSIDETGHQFDNSDERNDGLIENVQSNNHLLDNMHIDSKKPHLAKFAKTRAKIEHELKKIKIPRRKRKVQESKELTCQTCNKTFSTASSLRRHENRHKRVFMCEHCAKRVNTTFELEYHLAATHNIGGNLFICNDCGKKCYTKFRLKEHIRQHTGETPYICQNCGMKFHMRFAWTRHMRRHTNKSVPCEICNKMFHSVSDVKAHMNSMHERRYVYACKYCETTYAKSGTARRHMAEKHGVSREDQGKITRVELNQVPSSNVKYNHRTQNVGDNFG